VEISKLFSKDKAVNALTSIGALRFRISHSSLLHISLLLIILVITAMIRLLPLRWGFQLSEFDPHIHYRLTKNMVDNGFFAWASWTDPMSWYPQGYDISTAIFPGLAATAAFFYQIANALNLAPAAILSSDVYHPLTADPVFNFCVIFPVIMATLTVLVIYFVGRDIGGKEVGLFSAFFLALSASHISRTSLGFFDDETVGIFGILLFIFFFLRSIIAGLSFCVLGSSTISPWNYIDFRTGSNLATAIFISPLAFLQHNLWRGTFNSRKCAKVRSQFSKRTYSFGSGWNVPCVGHN
jgi:hypothetical protein